MARRRILAVLCCALAHGMWIGAGWHAAQHLLHQPALACCSGEHAAQLCIERLLRLRPGQSAEIRSSDRDRLMYVYRWMRAFDTTSYRTEYASATDPDDSHLQVTCRRKA